MNPCLTSVSYLVEYQFVISGTAQLAHRGPACELHKKIAMEAIKLA
jgi:hypothetical protein